MGKTKFIVKFLLTAGFNAMVVSNVFAQNGSGYFNQAENLFKAKNYYEASVVKNTWLRRKIQDRVQLHLP